MTRSLSTSVMLALLVLGAAACSESTTAGDHPGYFDTAGAPLVAPTEYSTGDAAATQARQGATGYFPTADAPLVAPSAGSSSDAASTLARQQHSGYFPDAGAPLQAPTTTTH